MSNEDIKALEDLKEALELNMPERGQSYLMDNINELRTNQIKAISNVLSELEKKDEEIEISDQLIERQNLEIDNLNSELETYKKIAEKLAEEISYTDNHICKYFDAINECKYEARKDNTNTCKQCIIDWARNEVEND